MHTNLTLFYQAIRNEQYVNIGSLKKPKGCQGALEAYFWDPFCVDDFLNQLPAVFIEVAYTKVPYCIQSIYSLGCRWMVQLNSIQSKTEAYEFKNARLFIPRSVGRPLAITGSHNLEQAIGFVVHDFILGRLGMVQGIYTANKQIMLAINHENQELLIPYGAPFVKETNDKAKTITTQLPKGYIDALLS